MNDQISVGVFCPWCEEALSSDRELSSHLKRVHGRTLPKHEPKPSVALVVESEDV